MDENKLIAITKLFDGSKIRSVWDSEKEDYYFSVVDVIGVLTNSKDPSDYWTTLKRRLMYEEGSELPTICRKLKLKTPKGRNYPTDVLDTKGIFRLIESVPSPKAEPFKMWLASLGKERIDEVFDPEIAINRSIKYYRNKGYSDNWIEKRLKGILDRNKLTEAWNESGIKEEYEYAILTNDIYKEWSGMSAIEYKKFKGLRKESLRDNMSDIEMFLTDLGEVVTRELVKELKPIGLSENKTVDRLGGHASKVVRSDIEKNLNKSIVSEENNTRYKYNKIKKEKGEEQNERRFGNNN